MDAPRLKDNFAQVAKNGDDVASYFYADLFNRNPAYRSLFPASMARQHQVLLGALDHIVSLVDNPQELVPYVEELGRSHAGFGITPDHYPEVGVSLLSTLEYFSGPSWDASLAEDWAAAYGLVADVMVQAGADKG